MRRSSASGEPDPDGGGAAKDPFAVLNHDGDAWLDVLRAAEVPRAHGRIGAYEILGEVRGGQGLVFRARQPHTGREIALKRLAAGTLSSAAERRRFEREVEVAASLSHPGIVAVHGVELVGGLPVLAMEWIDGEEITEWARRVPPGADGVRRKLAQFLAVCDAVEHAHRSGVIHRDLKPSNVLVDRSGAPRVLDFGLARRSGAQDDADPTRTLGFVGTPAYAPPESFTQEAAPIDARGDVWSLGVMLHEVLTGSRPFEAASFTALLRAIAEEEPQRPSSLAPGVGRELDTIIAKALAKAPEARYATVHALAEDVRRHLAGRPVLAMPPSAGYLLGKWVRRHKAESALAAALVILAVLVAIGGLWQAGRLADERDRAEKEALNAAEAAARAEAEALRAKDALAEAEAERRAANEARDRTAEALAKAEVAAAQQLRAREYYMDMLFRPFMQGTLAERAVALSSLQYAAEQAPVYFEDHPHLAVEALQRVAGALVNTGRLEEGLALAERTHALANDLAEARDEFRADAAALVAKAENLRGNHERARDYAAEAVSLFEAGAWTNRPGGHAEALLMLGIAESRLSELEAAEARFRRALEVLAGASEPLPLYDHLAILGGTFLGDVLAQQRELEEAETVLRAAWERGLATGNERDLVLQGAGIKLIDVYLLQRRPEHIPELYAAVFDQVGRLYPEHLVDLTARALEAARRLAELGAPAAAEGIYASILDHGRGDELLQAAAEEQAALGGAGSGRRRGE